MPLRSRRWRGGRRRLVLALWNTFLLHWLFSFFPSLSFPWSHSFKISNCAIQIWWTNAKFYLQLPRELKIWATQRFHFFTFSKCVSWLPRLVACLQNGSKKYFGVIALSLWLKYCEVVPESRQKATFCVPPEVSSRRDDGFVLQMTVSSRNQKSGYELTIGYAGYHGTNHGICLKICKER